MTPKKIVIVTSAQPAANPRAVKEAKSLVEAGYIVEFIYCRISPWADAFDKDLFSENPRIKWQQAGAGPEKRFAFLLARLRRRLSSIIGKKSAGALALFAPELKKAACRTKADLYIGHNLGALPAAVAAAKKFSARCGFDAEDFHRGEGKAGSFQTETAAAVENRFFPELDYLTVAAPLIGKAYQQLFLHLAPAVINNSFPKSFAVVKDLKKTEIKMFWFSQYIGRGRGLETVVDAIRILKDRGADPQLHLMGTIDPELRSYFEDLKAGGLSITIHPPGKLQDIFDAASICEIGLASEEMQSLNRDLCLTNKIFTYLLAGNCIAFSETAAQLQFLEDNPGIGFLYKDALDLSNQIASLAGDRQRLANMRTRSFECGIRKYHWEIEAKKFLSLVRRVLNSSSSAAA